MAFDPVKEYDQEIDKWEKEGRAILADLGPEFAPHPLGTKKVSSENVRWDYDNRGEDYWPARFDETLQRTSTEGGSLGDAVLELLKHDADMRK